MALIKCKNCGKVMDSENKISKAIQGIFAVAEQYPDLKANTNFMDLQNQLKKVEEDIANARKYYKRCKWNRKKHKLFLKVIKDM